MRRILAGMALLLLASCGGGDEPSVLPQTFPPLVYDYLTKLTLPVSSVTVDDSWVPHDGAEHVEQVAPIPPVDALRRMAQDRLVAAGGTGQAVLTIEDASLTRVTGQLLGSFAVRLTVNSGTPETGTRSAEARASVSGTRTLADTPEGDRAVAYDLVKKLMDDMNVEFEYQVRKTMKDQVGDGAAVPGAVQSQDLTPPSK